MAARGEDVPPGLGRQARLCGRSAEMDTPWSRGTPESTWISRQTGRSATWYGGGRRATGEHDDAHEAQPGRGAQRSAIDPPSLIHSFARQAVRSTRILAHATSTPTMAVGGGRAR